MGSNFTHGAMLMRLWRFDGSGELLAKFQYFDDAKAFGQMMVERDKERGGNKDGAYLYLAVCEYECAVQALFDPETVKPVKP